jgi:hypothetical protein
LSRPSDDLHLFADELNESVVREILEWRHHPELDRLVSKLLSHESRKAFFDAYAEALVARHLLKHDCQVRFEVETPQGKRADFEVHYRSHQFFLHVKRLDTQRPPHSSRRAIRLSSQLRRLESIPRPYIVQVRWNDDASNDQMRHLLKQAEEFIREAKVGDEMAARDDDGKSIGGVRILAPSHTDHVSVTIGLPGGFVDHTLRFRKMLQRAYQQFMPRATNVVLICSDHLQDAVDFETALLGTHVERWDAFPPRGRRVAHGRDVDGFWYGQRFIQSQYAGWFHFAPERGELRSRLWMRSKPGEDEAVGSLVWRIFGNEGGGSAD